MIHPDDGSNLLWDGRDRGFGLQFVSSPGGHFKGTAIAEDIGGALSEFLIRSGAGWLSETIGLCRKRWEEREEESEQHTIYLSTV